VRAAEFDFELPEELIAQRPAERREQSRLMVVERAGGRLFHHRFEDLPELLAPGDILARNDTRVVPARLVGRREATGGRWEGLFLGVRGDGTWEVLARTRGRPRPGEVVRVGQALRLALEAQEAEGRWIVRPLGDGEAVRGSGIGQPLVAFELLERHGRVPLPPYIRKGEESGDDRVRYQTVYARQPGSVAAPTAGLHFTKALFDRLAARDIPWADLTLRVGIGTFRPIAVEDVREHVMHAEWAELSPPAAAALNARRAAGGRIVAVGTTSARTLETAAMASGRIEPFSGPTDLFIRPGHVFRGLDALITNFHLPRSSLLVLVSALAGLELIREAYREAVRRDYRFFSYGDAMLIV
jgi:S-adenosylmethionine:tRNA ribosyltransferase-isomerase